MAHPVDGVKMEDILYISNTPLILNSTLIMKFGTVPELT